MAWENVEIILININSEKYMSEKYKRKSKQILIRNYVRILFIYLRYVYIYVKQLMRYLTHAPHLMVK